MISGKFKRRRRLFMSVGIPLLVTAVPCVLTYRAVRQERLNRALIDATSRYAVATIRSLLHQGADPNALVDFDTRSVWQRIGDVLTHRNTSELHGSCSSALYEAVAEPPSATLPSTKFYSPHNLETVKILVNTGARADTRGYDGTTPLMDAAKYDEVEVARVLLAHNADVNAVDDADNTPLYDVCVHSYLERPNMEIAKMLVAHNANVNLANKDGDTPLLEAVDSINAVLVDLLLSKGANVNTVNRLGQNPFCEALMLSVNASVSNQHRIVQALLQHGALTTGRDQSEDTPLQSAIHAHDSWLVGILRRADPRE